MLSISLFSGKSLLFSVDLVLFSDLTVDFLTVVLFFVIFVVCAVVFLGVAGVVVCVFSILGCGAISDFICFVLSFSFDILVSVLLFVVSFSTVSSVLGVEISIDFFVPVAFAFLGCYDCGTIVALLIFGVMVCVVLVIFSL